MASANHKGNGRAHPRGNFASLLTYWEGCGCGVAAGATRGRVIGRRGENLSGMRGIVQNEADGWIEPRADSGAGDQQTSIASP
jgi:hypothetical protein